MTHKILRLALFVVATIGKIAAAPIAIPDPPATVQYGPFTIPYPEDWTKRNAKITEGIVLEPRDGVMLSNKECRLGINVGKDPNLGFTLADCKRQMTAEFEQQAKAIDETIQKTIGKEVANQAATLHYVDVGKWALEIEKRDGVEIMRSHCTTVISLNGQMISIHTEGLWQVVPDGIYSVSFAYPLSMKTDYEPFVDWLMKHIKVSP